MAGSRRGPRVFIWVEDYYARDFLLALLGRLNLAGPRPLVKSAKGRGNLINRLGRTAIDVLVAWGYDKLIALVDGHGDPEGTARACMRQVPGHLRSRVHLIAFAWSIEEWICVGLCLPLAGQRPLDVLLKHERRRKGAWVRDRDVKRWLASYASRLDLVKLRQNALFKRFLTALEDCPQGAKAS